MKNFPWARKQEEDTVSESGWAKGGKDTRAWSDLLYSFSSNETNGFSGITAATVGEHLMTAADAEYKELHTLYGAEPIDSRILSMMRAVEWFADRRGDLWLAFTAPLDVGLPEPIIQSEDRKVQQIFEDEYERLGVPDIAGALWLACEQYGQAYPLILPGEPVSVTLLNPKHVAVGRSIGMGVRPLTYTPLKETHEALISSEKNRDKELFLNALQEDWNDWIEKEKRGFPLNPEYVTHVHHRKHWHRRYAIPPAARVLDDLATRLVLDEMVRGTIEGLHTQWRVWILEKPKRGATSKLMALLKSSRSERTADLVWGDATLKDVKTISPVSIDRLLAPEAWWRLTLSIYRGLGMFVNVVSGEDPASQGRAASDASVNIQILLARLNYQRSRTLAWLRKLNRAIAKSHGIKELPTVSLEPLLIEWEAKLRAVLPILGYGLMSAETFHNWIGLDSDKELARLKKEMPLRDDGTIRPYTGFAQAGPSGTTEHPVSPGRPQGPAPETSPQNKENATHAVTASANDYEDDISRAYSLLAETPLEDKEKRSAGVLAFIATLLALRSYRGLAFEQGYLEGGGFTTREFGETPQYIHAMQFDQENLANFQEKLLARVEAGEHFTEAYRATEYARSGWKQAYMDGMFLAKKESGFTGWQRVLHPELSRAGPCPECVADSRVVHSLDEPFFDHPNGVCGSQYVVFNMGGGGWTFPYTIPHYGGLT